MLSEIKYLILDMDGVLWRGDSPMNGLPDFFDGLAQLGIQVAFATNNASKSPADYVAKFDRFGVKINPQQVMTSALATADFLAATIDPPGPIYVLGANGLHEALSQIGFELLPRFEIDRRAAAVAVGFTQQAVYADFAAAGHHIRYHGARFVGCNPDVTFPSENGLQPGNGSFLALIEAATDTEPDIIGKPFPRMFEACLKKLGPAANKNNTAVVGDRLNTDIAGGLATGLKTILVLTGVSDQTQLNQSKIKPNLVTKNISTLLKEFQNSSTHNTQ